jgi:hypothetical protein
MSNSTELFNDYYLQFATPASFEFVASEFPIGRLLGSKDKHLNDLCKYSNGGTGSWTWDFTPINLSLIREAGESNSMATHTCVGKAIAKKMLSDYHSANS